MPRGSATILVAVSGILPDIRLTWRSRELCPSRLATSLAPRQDAGESGLEARAPPRTSFCIAASPFYSTLRNVLLRNGFSRSCATNRAASRGGTKRTEGQTNSFTGTRSSESRTDVQPVSRPQARAALDFHTSASRSAESPKRSRRTSNLSMSDRNRLHILRLGLPL